MKTLIGIVLCLCVGCGVSEQEKLAKRLNDKMDCEERMQRKEKVLIERQNEIIDSVNAEHGEIKVERIRIEDIFGGIDE